STDSLIPFTPPKPAAWEWGWQSAERLSRPTAGGCGPRPVYRRVPHSSSGCPRKVAAGHDRSICDGLSREPTCCNIGCFRPCCMSEEQPIVFVIDDDPSVRDAITDLLQSVGVEVKAFRSAQEFLQSKRPDAPGCIVLDVRLPGAS